MTNVSDIDFNESTVLELSVTGQIFNMKVEQAHIGQLWATVSVDFYGVGGLLVNDKPATVAEMGAPDGEILGFTIDDEAAILIVWNDFVAHTECCSKYVFSFENIKISVLSTYTKEEYFRE